MGEATLRAHDYLRIAAEARCDPRTVRAAYTGARMQHSTWQAVERAARKLQLAPPLAWARPGQPSARQGAA